MDNQFLRQAIYSSCLDLAAAGFVVSHDATIGREGIYRLAVRVWGSTEHFEAWCDPNAREGEHDPLVSYQHYSGMDGVEESLKDLLSQLGELKIRAGV